LISKLTVLLSGRNAAANDIELCSRRTHWQADFPLVGCSFALRSYEGLLSRSEQMFPYDNAVA
jgi:hypothetical protein